MLVPPHNNRYIAWGFGDSSMRTGFYETERVITVLAHRLLYSVFMNTSTIKCRLSDGKNLEFPLWLWFSVSSNLVLRRSAPPPPPLLHWPIETMAIWTTFICWYVNQSFIFFFDDLFQILAVYENFHIGQVLCASCPDSHTLITGGTSTVSMTSQVVCMMRRNYALAQGIEKRKEVEMVNCIKDSVANWSWSRDLLMRHFISRACLHWIFRI